MPAKKNNTHGKQFSKDYQPEEKWTEEKALKVGNDLIEWLKKEEENIYYEDFLYLENDYYSTLIAYLSNKFKSFSKLMEKAKSIQRIKLIKFGTFDKLNASITKFVLNVEHGMIEKKQKDINNSEQKVTVELSKETIKRLDSALEKD